MVIGGMLVLWASLSGLSSGMSPRLGGSWLGTLLSDTLLLVRYIGNMIFPASISFLYHSDAITSLLDWRVWASVALLAAMITLSIAVSRDRRLTVFLWCWFFVALAPALNIAPIWQHMQDRYAYYSLPAMLAIAALAGAGAYWRVTRKEASPRLAAAAVGVPLVLLAPLTYWQSFLYQKDVFLFKDAAAKEPTCLYAHSFLGQALARDANRLEISGGDPKAVHEMRTEAADECAQALVMPGAAAHDTFTTDLKLTMGSLLGRLGHPQHGRELLLKGMAENPDKQRNLFAMISLAQLEIEAGRPRDALSWLDRAGQLTSPDSPGILLQVGFCNEQLGALDQALKAYRAISANAPESPCAALRIAEIEKNKK